MQDWKIEIAPQKLDKHTVLLFNLFKDTGKLQNRNKKFMKHNQAV